MELTRWRDMPFPPAYEKPYKKSDNNRLWIQTVILPSLQKKVRTHLVKRWLLLGCAVWVIGEVWGCLLFYVNLFTHHWFQMTTFHNLHAGFGLEAMSLERSNFTSNFPVLHEAAITARLRLAAGGVQIGLHVTKNTWSSAATYPVLPIIINKRKYQRKFSTVCLA